MICNNYYEMGSAKCPAEMRVTCYHKPRQSGRTSLLVNMFLLNPDDTLFIVYKEMQKENLLRIFPVLRGFEKNIISLHRIIKNKGLIGRRVKNVLIDDYEVYSSFEKENLYENLKPLLIENVVIMEVPFSKVKTLKDEPNYREYKL